METPGSQEHKAKEPLRFRQEVTIKGLPYVFEGDIPQEPADFRWSVSVPNWEEQKPKVEEMVRNAEANPRFGEINPRWVRSLEAYHLGGGRVGFLDIKKAVHSDEAPAVGIGIVQTATAYLPQAFGYHQAEGIGSFLLTNLCALADIKKWRIYLEPVDKGGKLDQYNLYRWYNRKGFEDNSRFPKESRHSFGGMQRWPKELDTSQVVAAILQSASPKK